MKPLAFPRMVSMIECIRRIDHSGNACDPDVFPGTDRYVKLN